MLEKNFLILFLISTCIFSSYGQKKDSLVIKNGIDKPNTLTLHHFGIFSSRINQNFKKTPPKNNTLNFSIESGNTIHPFVEAYFPKDPLIREELSNVTWFHRQFTFIDQETTPADYMNIVVDAVIKRFRIDYNIKLAKKHELGITLRSFLINDGKYPFSFFTSDETLEWFHSNIAGGEDPFGRRYYGLNKVDFGNNQFLGSLESEIEFTKYTLKGNYHTFGLNYQIQTRYNKIKEADYYKLLGKWEEINAGWHNGVSTTYQNMSNWSAIYTYGTPKYKLMLYLKEDFLVNNAPDIQTGVSIKVPVSKK